MRTMDARTILRTHLPYTGEAPFGSCFQQGAANVLEALGLVDAELAIGTAWGASWQGGAKLGGSNRWVEGLRAISGLRVNRLRSDSWEVARDRERELLDARLPVIAGVDSFGIPSPHRGQTHLVHAVIVLDSDPGGVTFCDPMNRPCPARMSIAPYARLRAADCVERYEMLVCEGRPTRQLDPLRGARMLARDAARNMGRDSAAIAGFADWVELHGSGEIDVAEVGAERLYAAKLLGAAARRDSHFSSHAKTLASLARRWYLLHTLVLESRDGRSLSASRVTGMLRDLGRREADTREALASTIGRNTRAEFPV